MKKFLCLILAMLMLGLCAACAEDYAVTVASPSGAPGVALATLAVQAPDNYTYVAAETISAEFINANADFIIAPVNAGAKLFKLGKSTYQLCGVVSWGNLFIASQREGFTLADMNGQKVTLFAENTINSAVVLYCLEQNGIVPSEIEYLAAASNTQALLLSDPYAIVLTAEPALTAAMMKNSAITGYSVNEMYKAATGFDGFTQAGLFVRAQTAAEHPEVVEAFLAQAAAACELCTTDVPAAAEAAVTMGLLPNQKVAEKAIPGCSIRFVPALEAREQLETVANIDLSQFGGALPADEFYYGYAAE
ncbi:MAG: ABC transporter substrate-binding protein [Clostridia bacterium]|nr:ABC transporter substrate-binding protein [Clostridia bacterium]